MAEHRDDQRPSPERPWRNLSRSAKIEERVRKAEALRTRELYKYYIPDDGLDDIKDDSLRDPSLYAFVQLTAFQLNVKQALLSLIDSDTQYLIADSGSAVDGFCRVKEFERQGRLCMKTLVLPPKIHTFEVADLSQDDEYKNVDFVKNEPHMRFYAGTPIKTSKGLNIGTLCLLDDRVRALTDVEKDSLTLIGGLIMQHLEITRKQREQEIGVRMQSSLGRFVSEGAMRKSLGARGWKADPQTHTHLHGDKPASKPAITEEQSLSKSVQDTYQRAGMYIADAMSRVNTIIFASANGEIIKEWRNNNKQDDLTNGVSSNTKGKEEKVWTGTDFASNGRKSSGLNAISSTTTILSPGVISQFVSSFPLGRIFTCSVSSPMSSSSDDGYFPTENLQWTHDNERTMIHLLRELAPECVSTILFPLYDEFGEISSIGMAFTNFETRVFTSEELNYLNIFGNTIMSEVALLSTISADNEKKKFISSISHELRSPLHGILAGAELLLETDLQSLQVEHLETIQHCGDTLLDTLNHVLDYSTLDSVSIRDAHHANKTRRPSHDNTDPKAALSKLERSEFGNPHEAVRSLDLAELTGEIVDVVLTGHAHKAKVIVESKISTCKRDEDESSYETDFTGDNLVTKIVDVATGDDWFYEVPSAAYRRVLMNLLGNALKYTYKGFVRIGLSCKKNDSGVDDVQLIVADSGKGISEDFLAENLFKPFTQEDTLAPGTGLGMTIVGLLVQNMGGTIKAESHIGVGTTFTVTFPFKRGIHKDGLKNQLLKKHATTLQGRTAALIGFSADSRLDETTIMHRRNAVERHLDMLHIKFEYQTIEEYMNTPSPKVDLVLVNGLSDKLRCKGIQAFFYDPRLPTAILHGNRMLKLTPEMKHPRLAFCHLPCGPAKFANALDALTTSSLKAEMSDFKAFKDRDVEHELNIGLSKLSITHRLQDGIVNVTPPITPPLSVTIRKPRVLVVDDNPINLKLLVQLLKVKQYEYQIAENGLIALEKFQCHPKGFDIVLMDLQMPIMNGIDSTKAIREHELKQKGPRCKIIALTGLAAKNDMNEAMKAGMDLFWTKPVSMKNLMAELNAWEVQPRTRVQS